MLTSPCVPAPAAAGLCTTWGPPPAGRPAAAAAVPVARPEPAPPAAAAAAAVWKAPALLAPAAAADVPAAPAAAGGLGKAPSLTVLVVAALAIAGCPDVTSAAAIPATAAGATDAALVRVDPGAVVSPPAAAAANSLEHPLHQLCRGIPRHWLARQHQWQRILLLLLRSWAWILLLPARLSPAWHPWESVVVGSCRHGWHVLVPSHAMLPVCALQTAVGLWVEGMRFPLLGRTVRHTVLFPGPRTISASFCDAFVAVGMLPMYLVRS